MKKLLLPLLALCTLFSIETKASHVAGAEITYKYIGDSTGVPFQYQLYLTLYRRDNPGSAGLGPTQSLDINSNCGGSGVTVTRFYRPQDSLLADGGIYPDAFADCMDPGSQAYADGKISQHNYTGTVTLPGHCVYTFSWSMCCRNTNVTNLNDASSYSLYVESTLDNTIGPNSSPRFLTPGTKALCVNRPFHWGHSAYEPDGDSIRFVLAQPLGGPTTPIPWEAGFNTNQPMSTQSGFHLNTATGMMSFTPAAQEVGVIKIIVEEYRYDTIQMNWRLISSISRDLQYLVTVHCATETPEILGLDSLWLQCGSDRIEITIDTEVNCNSIAADGSDFALINSHGTLFPIVAAGSLDCKFLATNSLWIQLYDSLYYNDTLHLISRMGNDLNTLVSTCGSTLPESDSLQVTVSTCTTGVGLKDIKPLPLHVFPNPAKETLNVVFPASASKREIVLMDLQGRVLQKLSATEPKVSIDVAGLTRGFYILRATDEEAVRTTTFEKL